MSCPPEESPDCGLDHTSVYSGPALGCCTWTEGCSPAVRTGVCSIRTPGFPRALTAGSVVLPVSPCTGHSGRPMPSMLLGASVHHSCPPQQVPSQLPSWEERIIGENLLPLTVIKPKHSLHPSSKSCLCPVSPQIPRAAICLLSFLQSLSFSESSSPCFDAFSLSSKASLTSVCTQLLSPFSCSWPLLL